MEAVRASMRPRAESSYRQRHAGGAAFYTSRRAYDDLTVVVKRFPHQVAVGGPDFVLVHGIGVSSRYYHPVAAELAKQSRHLFGDHIEDRLAEVPAKTLVLVGNHDLVVTLAWAQFVADGIAGSTFAVVRGPHLVMYGDPVHVAEHIAEHAAS